MLSDTKVQHSLYRWNFAMMYSNIYLMEREGVERKGTGNYTKKMILVDVSSLATGAANMINMEMGLGLGIPLK